MAHTAVRDVVIWAKHIHGDDEVQERILALRGGETVDLLVDGWQGPWVRMKDGKDGRPTRGIRPIGRTQAFWSELFEARRGDLVSLQLASPRTSAADMPPQAPTNPARPGFRHAAREALLRGLSGYRSHALQDRETSHSRAEDRDGL